MAKRIARSQVGSVLAQLVSKQKNRCAICGTPFTGRDPAVLDHDHETGFIRGALHRSCNGTEGKVKVTAQRCHKGVKSYDYLIKLGEYLQLHSSPQVNLIHPEHKTEDEKRIERNKKAREARLRKKKRIV